MQAPVSTNQILRHLAQTSPMRRREVTKVAKVLLLAGACFANDGEHYTIKAKSLGAGVYEVWAEKAP